VADAIEEICRRSLYGADSTHGAPHDTAGAGARHHRRAELAVLIDYETLLSQLHESGICTTEYGTPIPASVARQLACEAGIIPMVLSGGSVVLDQGRSKRFFTDAQVRALRVMFGRCCFADCTVSAPDCEAHHLVPFSQGGATDLDNGGIGCSSHHALIHREGWCIQRVGDELHTLQPDGTLFWVRKLKRGP
jgi:hypothetical protein